MQLYPTGGIDFADETAVLVIEKLQRHRQLMALGKNDNSCHKLAWDISGFFWFKLALDGYPIDPNVPLSLASDGQKVTTTATNEYSPRSVAE